MKKLKHFAVESAKERIGKPYRFGNNWRYSIWVEDCNAYTESTPRPYYEMLAHRSQHLIDCARQIMGMESVEYRGGDWFRYLD
jgi:hypothetical protein